MEHCGQEIDDSPTKFSQSCILKAAPKQLDLRKEFLANEHKTSNLCLSTSSMNQAVSQQLSSPALYETTTKKVDSRGSRPERATQLPASGSNTLIHSLPNAKELLLPHHSTGRSQHQEGTINNKQQTSGPSTQLRISRRVKITPVFHKSPLSRLESALQQQYAKLTSTQSETEGIAAVNSRILDGGMPSETIKQEPIRAQHTSRSQRLIQASKTATSSELTSNNEYSKGRTTRNSSSTRAIVLEYGPAKADLSSGRNIKERNSVNYPARSESTRRFRISRRGHTPVNRHSNTVASSLHSVQIPEDAEVSRRVLSNTEAHGTEANLKASLRQQDKSQLSSQAGKSKSQSSHNMDKAYSSSSGEMWQGDNEPQSTSRQKYNAATKQNVSTFGMAQKKSSAPSTPQSQSIERTLMNNQVRNGVRDNRYDHGLPTPESSGTSSDRATAGCGQYALATPKSRRSISTAATAGSGFGTTNTMSESQKSRQTPPHLQSIRDKMDINRKSVSPSMSDFRPSPPKPIEGEYERRKRIEASRYVLFAPNVI